MAGVNGGKGGGQNNNQPLTKEQRKKMFRFYCPSKQEQTLARVAFEFAKGVLLEKYGTLNLSWATPEEKLYVLLPYCENVKMIAVTEEGTFYPKVKVILPKKDGDPLSMRVKVESNDKQKLLVKEDIELPWKEIKYGRLDKEQIFASSMITNASVVEEEKKFSLLSGKPPKKMKPRRKGRLPEPIKERNMQNARTPLWMYMERELWEGEEI